MRSLDFTACTRECSTHCWRKLSKEEVEWLENNPNRMSYADLSDGCEDYKPIKDKRWFNEKPLTVSNLFQMEDDFMELEDGSFNT